MNDNSNKVIDVDINEILPNRFQPRIQFDEEEILELSDSIKEHGVIQPLVVRTIGDKYEIIAGERRYKASILAGKQTIPAIITELNEKDSAEVAIIENVQRKDLTPIEEAISYKKILDMGYLTQDSLALKLGKTQSTIANKLRLLNLDDDVQEALLNEKISERHARSLLKLDSHEKQRNLLKRIIDERLTVRKTDEEIDKMMNNNENLEMLNFGVQTTPVEELNNKPVETFEMFNPNIEELNIPTTPIVENSIPEVLPTVEPKATTSFFNPEPAVINSNVPPVTLDMFKEINEPVINSNPVLTGSVPMGVMPETPALNEIKTDVNNMTDIFIEKPLANMDDLLQSTNISEPVFPSVMPVEAPQEESNEDILVPGKFFNLLSDEDEEKTEPIEQNVQNSLPSLDSFFFDTNLSNPTPEETLSSFRQTEEKMPVEINTSEVENGASAEVKEETNNNNLEMPAFNFDMLLGNNEANTNLTETEVTPVVTENNVEPAIPELNVVGNAVPVEPVNTTNIKQAIDLVREFSDKLSNLGFTINVDEFDFENMYQVVLKINK